MSGDLPQPDFPCDGWGECMYRLFTWGGQIIDIQSACGYHVKRSTYRGGFKTVTCKSVHITNLRRAHCIFQASWDRCVCVGVCVCVCVSSASTVHRAGLQHLVSVRLTIWKGGQGSCTFNSCIEKGISAGDICMHAAPGGIPSAEALLSWPDTKEDRAPAALSVVV